MASVGRKKGVVRGVLQVLPLPAGSYLAFFDQGGSVSASLYGPTGAYVSEVGSAQTYSGSTPTSGKVLLIRADPQGVVAANSLAWWEAGEITVIQPEVGSATFSVLSSGWDADGFAWSDADGYFYWMEHEHTPHTGSTTTFRLRKCKADGTSATTVSSVDYTPSNDHDGNLLPTFGHWKADSRVAYGFRATTAACYLSAVWADAGDGTKIFMTCRLAFAGGGATDDFDTDRGGYARPQYASYAIPSGSLFVKLFSGGTQSAADTLLATPADVWPNTGDWSVGPNNMDILDTDAFLYGGALGIRNASSGAGASPRQRITFADHPSLATSPTWVFMAS